MSQQWLGGTAEWSEPLSSALGLLGNRLAPRSRTSHLRWPQTQGQEWGTGPGHLLFSGLLSAQVQAWFISMLLNSWLCHVFSLAIIWAACHESSHSLSFKDAVYWRMHIYWAARNYPGLKSDVSKSTETMCVYVCENPKLHTHVVMNGHNGDPVWGS